MNEIRGTTRRDEERRCEMKQKIEKERAQMSGTQISVEFRRQHTMQYTYLGLIVTVPRVSV